MATGTQVLTMLIPNGGWVIYGDDFDSIIYDEGVTPITQEAFDAGFNQFDTWSSNQQKSKSDAKSALFERLGITADEAALLLQ